MGSLKLMIILFLLLLMSGCTQYKEITKTPYISSVKANPSSVSVNEEFRFEFNIKNPSESEIIPYIYLVFDGNAVEPTDRELRNIINQKTLKELSRIPPKTEKGYYFNFRVLEDAEIMPTKITLHLYGSPQILKELDSKKGEINIIQRG
jgi:outer membrane lipoprotein-sorting protein